MEPPGKPGRFNGLADTLDDVALHVESPAEKVHDKRPRGSLYHAGSDAAASAVCSVESAPACSDGGTGCGVAHGPPQTQERRRRKSRRKPRKGSPHAGSRKCRENTLDVTLSVHVTRVPLPNYSGLRTLFQDGLGLQHRQRCLGRMVQSNIANQLQVACHTQERLYSR